MEELVEEFGVWGMVDGKFVNNFMSCWKGIEQHRLLTLAWTDDAIHPHTTVIHLLTEFYIMLRYAVVHDGRAHLKTSWLRGAHNLRVYSF